MKWAVRVVVANMAQDIRRDDCKRRKRNGDQTIILGVPTTPYTVNPSFLSAVLKRRFLADVNSLACPVQAEPATYGCAQVSPDTIARSIYCTASEAALD